VLLYVFPISFPLPIDKIREVLPSFQKKKKEGWLPISFLFTKLATFNKQKEQSATHSRSNIKLLYSSIHQYSLLKELIRSRRSLATALFVIKQVNKQQKHKFILH
jgi:hypothetical protein